MCKVLTGRLIIILSLASGTGVDLHLQWMRELPIREPAWQFTSRMPRDIAFEPVVQDELVLVGCAHNDTVLALDLETGRNRLISKVVSSNSGAGQMAEQLASVRNMIATIVEESYLVSRAFGTQSSVMEAKGQFLSDLLTCGISDFAH
jgi:hypothetical protein